METRVKERLIGAIILVAAIVLLVPEMLSGPRSDSSSAAATDSTAVRTYTIDLAAPDSRIKPNTPDADPAPASPAADTADAPTETVNVESEAQRPTQSEDTKSRPAPSKAAPPTGTDNAKQQPAWAVQLGSFASEANAERLTTQLKARGYKAFVSRLDSGSRTRYRVRVGPEEDRSRAESLADRLRRDGQAAVVVPLP